MLLIVYFWHGSLIVSGLSPRVRWSESHGRLSSWVKSLKVVHFSRWVWQSFRLRSWPLNTSVFQPSNCLFMRIKHANVIVMIYSLVLDCLILVHHYRVIFVMMPSIATRAWLWPRYCRFTLNFCFTLLFL